MLGFSKIQWNTLHLTWVAFFLTFVAWFNMAPFNTTIMHALGLSSAEINVLMVCNVALTIPARIIIGFWVDRYGPRIVFSILLVFSALVCFGFALSQSTKPCFWTWFRAPPAQLALTTALAIGWSTDSSCRCHV